MNDNCSAHGIRDWILDFITLEVFKYLECDTEVVKENLLKTLDEAFVQEGINGYSEIDILKFQKDIENLLNRNERLLDGYEDGIYSKEKYQERKLKNDEEISRIQQIIDAAKEE